MRLNQFVSSVSLWWCRRVRTPQTCCLPSSAMTGRLLLSRLSPSARWQWTMQHTAGLCVHLTICVLRDLRLLFWSLQSVSRTFGAECFSVWLFKINKNPSDTEKQRHMMKVGKSQVIHFNRTSAAANFRSEPTTWCLYLPQTIWSNVSPLTHFKHLQVQLHLSNDVCQLQTIKTLQLFESQHKKVKTSSITTVVLVLLLKWSEYFFHHGTFSNLTFT